MLLTLVLAFYLVFLIIKNEKLLLGKRNNIPKLKLFKY